MLRQAAQLAELARSIDASTREGSCVRVLVATMLKVGARRYGPVSGEEAAGGKELNHPVFPVAICMTTKPQRNDATTNADSTRCVF